MVTVQRETRTVLPSSSEALEFLHEASGHHLSVDTETTGLRIRDGRDYTQGVSLGFRRSDGLQTVEGAYFPFRHRFGENYGTPVIHALRDVIESAPTLTFHNAKFDIVALRQLDIPVRSGSWIDTMIMAHLINENWPYSKSLDNLAVAYGIGETKEMPEEMAKIVNDKNLGWSWVPSEMMYDYASQDTIVTLLLRDVLWPKFVAEGLDKYWPYKARLIEVVIEMERRGIGIDVEFVKGMIDASEQAIQDYTELLGGYSPTSPKDLKSLLIDELQLPIVKRSNKTGAPSFDKEAMGIYEQILAHHSEPLAEYILGGRGWTHARGLFYRPYLELLSPDGKLRPEYKHHKDAEEGGTVTGRLSCQNPNLQQIPRVTNKPWNGRVKQSFKASEGYSLWEADYAQLELRLGTAYAKEPTLKEIFKDGHYENVYDGSRLMGIKKVGRDIFTELANTLGWDRQNTKGFVYSTQYGAGKVRISHVFGVTEDAAQGLINQYYQRFPNFKLISDDVKNRVLSRRKIRLWSGRYRHFANPNEENHKGFNSLIQGGAADVVERVMIALFDRIDQQSNDEVRMLLQVHDSVVFEIKDGREDYWGPKIVEVMSEVNQICMDFDVEFAVELKRFGK